MGANQGCEMLTVSETTVDENPTGPIPRPRERGDGANPTPGPEPIAIGTRVELMSGKPDLDGQRGVVTAFIASSGLCSVELEDGRGSVNIKPENLVAKGRGGGDANADFPAESVGQIP